MDVSHQIMIKLVAIILFAGIITYHVPMQAELLVMKQTEAGFASLDESDNENKVKIEEILLKYQWPTSAAFALAPLKERRKILAETGDLFTPNKPNAEEIWIEQKIQQETGNDTYRVIFFPTTLYELSVILQAYTVDATDHFGAFYSIANRYKSTINLLDILNDDKSNYAEVRKDILNVYMAANKIPSEKGDNVYSYINQSLTAWLLNQYPELKNSKDSIALSETIKNMSDTIMKDVIQGLQTLRYRLFTESLQKIIPYLKHESYTHIITKYIAFEYEARAVNKALLVRGTTFEKFEPINSNDISKEKSLAGTTLWQKEYRGTFQDISPEQAYKEKKSTPYSIAFGNSLFAGCYRDHSACAYAFLNGVRASSFMAGFSKNSGYVLFINKYDYIKNQNAALFFIPPLSTLAALIQSGEFFHARSKAAIGSKLPGNRQRVKGLMWYGMEKSIEDPTGVLLITRDPLKHAALFSEFLVNNGRIIQKGDESLLTDEEKQFAKDVMKAQEEAAGYYKGIRYIVPRIDEPIRRARESIAAKKATQEAAPMPAPAATSETTEKAE